MSSIRGSASYWKKYTADIIAMIKQLGIPTFFFTFSFDDLNSFDCVNAMWKQEYGFDCPDVDPSQIPFLRRKELLNKYPVIAARHFNLRLHKFLALLNNEAESIFGHELLDYTVRVEFQERGSPHAHMLLWLKDVPEWSTPEGIAVIERNISCSLQTPLKELVIKYQNHRHSQTCFKKMGAVGSNSQGGCLIARGSCPSQRFTKTKGGSSI